MENKKDLSTKEIVKSIPALTKIAGIFFIIGKIHFIPAAAFALININTAWIFAGIYIFCIVSAISLTLIDIARLNKKDRESDKAPSVEQLRKWARQHNLTLGVENEQRIERQRSFG